MTKNYLVAAFGTFLTVSATSRDQLGVALENAQITMSSRERVEFMDKLAKLR